MSEYFPYRDGALVAEGVPVARVAAAVGTPFYLYSAAAFADRYRSFAAAFAAERPLVCYAVKANSNLAVLRLFAGLGAGADVVSEGELRRALAAGVPPERIVFSGVGKTAAELAFALDSGIHQVNVESLPELRLLGAVAAARGRGTRVAIRVNPDVSPDTHAKIATGGRDNKFGIEAGMTVDAYRLAASLPGIEPVGLAVHIGSQIGELAPLRQAFTVLAELVRELRAAGLPVRSVDLGGGLGLRYRDETTLGFAEYAELVRDVFGQLDVALAFEPGRTLVGTGGLLVASVVHVKEATARRFVVLDAAMNDLIRPALYEAWHDIVPVREPALAAPFTPADIVGPVCESGDTFAVDRALPPLAAGDLVAFKTAGAYGAVMSSTYNTRLLVPEVLVSGDRFAVVRRRPSYDELLSLDIVPEWLPDSIAEPSRQRGAA